MTAPHPHSVQSQNAPPPGAAPHPNPAPLPSAAPIPSAAPLPYQIPSAAPIPCPLTTAIANTLPMKYTAPIPSAAPIPLPAPLPPSYTIPTPGLPPPPILSSSSLRQPPIPSSSFSRQPPQFEPKTTAPININKKLIQDFISQNFKLEPINEQKSVLVKSSNPKYFIIQRRHRAISRISALPIIKQFSIKNDSKLVYYKMCNRDKSEIIALKDTVSKNKKNKDNDWDSEEEEYEDDDDYYRNKIIAFLQGNNKNKHYENDNDYLQEKLERITTMNIDSSNSNMLIIGTLPKDIGIVLNNEIINNVEPVVNDYRYPLRNSHIIYQIMMSRGIDLARMRGNVDYVRRYRLVAKENRLNLGVTREQLKKIGNTEIPNNLKIIRNTEKLKNMRNTEIQKQMCHIRNHDKEFKNYKVRIHDLVDPNLNSIVNDEKMIYIPSIFKYSLLNDNIEICSDINNLSRLRFPKLYKIISSVFKQMLPSFEWILKSDFKMEKVSQFRVVVKLQNYEIYPNMNYCSLNHREGLDEEKIVAVGVYYYYKSECFDEDKFEISHNFKIGGLFGNIDEQDIKQVVDIKQDQFIVFNNKHKYLHRVTNIHNKSTEYIAKRKIMTFFLVDPYLSNYDKNKMKTSKDTVVNVDDKYELIICYWLRECKCYKVISNDIMHLLMLYAVKDQKEAISKRDVLKINEFVKDAENQWKNRPKPRRKD